MPADPYALLGLSKSATAAEIKQAYRKLARSSHPDLNLDDAGAEARFKAISAAHDLLKDPATRARFDAGEIDDTGAERPPRQYYRDFAEDPGQTYRPRGGTRSPFGDGSDPNDIFAEFLRQGGAGPSGFAGQGYAAQGRDLRFGLEVAFLDAARGADLRLSLGEGGDISVKIPPGAEDGQTLRLRGRGVARADGSGTGDQRVELRIVAPTETDSALRDFLVGWRKSHPQDPRAKLMDEAAS